MFLALVMIVLGVYLFFVPPPGFEENLAHRIVLPFVLVAGAFGVMENLRTRTHLGQLVGAIRSLMGRRGVEPAPEVKGEAIEILIRSLKNSEGSVRQAAATQLHNLTGREFGEDLGAWEGWWSENKGEFGR